MKHLFILNDPPYGTERSYNALRLARELLKDPAAGHDAKVLLMGDAVACAKAGRKVPQGDYNTESMIHGVAARGAQVGVCATCMDARHSPRIPRAIQCPSNHSTHDGAAGCP